MPFSSTKGPLYQRYNLIIMAQITYEAVQANGKDVKVGDKLAKDMNQEELKKLYENGHWFVKVVKTKQAKAE